MEIWDEIVKTALVGTERQVSAFPGAPQPLSALLAQVDPMDKEQALLQASALLTGYRRAGTTLRTGTPSISTAPEDSRLCLPAAILDDLLTMVRGEYREALPEWFNAMSTGTWRAPEEHLDTLLDFGRGHSEYRAGLMPLLGSRGRWLAAQNTDWKYALQLNLFEQQRADEVGANESDMTAEWQTGSGEERIALLQQLRRSNPELARTLIESTWSEESAETRAAFLTTLETSVSMNDEPLLESALDDRRKEVRTVAQDLLRLLPESRLCARMWNRCSKLVRFHTAWLGRESIQVDLPDECDTSMTRDGIEAKPAPGGGGPKTWWLLQMVRSIPLLKWTQAWGRTPEQIVTAALKSRGADVDDGGRMLMEAWTAALARSRDSEWAAALFHCSVQDKQIPPSPTVPWAEMLPARLFEEGVQKLLTRTGKQSFDSHEVLQLLSHYRTPWSPEFARAVLHRLLNDKNPYQIASALAEYSPRIPVEVRDEYLAAWAEQIGNNSYLQGQMNHFLALEAFRVEMRRKIKSIR